ncbi:uncharacterized protein LOC106156001 [Lingula anatina]|uniref:Uncharacterized protein LOC106156001 n=1 Tax=Lingula anatina TaxID=7574 RepID=A0A1S3HM07_LINAN|nr:uncharacterized protein LOC106156001 [Lingula anatina]XP_013386512.1 uncharacterized protein LOC106156001 [Lingula anatina]XP_013386513.1 uncharacterized protein LOC106156001 [Lingula anatina]|eukprot:XP_013386511.1 uncharacterized protein LOC106156001 [Lingula anatina]
MGTNKKFIYVLALLLTIVTGSVWRFLWVNKGVLVNLSSRMQSIGVWKSIQQNPQRLLSAISDDHNELPESVNLTFEHGYVVFRPRNYSQTTGKRFVYLIQSPSKGVIKGLQETKERDVIWMTFGDMSGDIYAPGTSHLSGRNVLLQHAVNLAAQMKDGGYLYYILLDDDVELSVRTDGQVNWKAWSKMASDPYQRFEEFLMHYQPAVGYVRYQDMSRQFVNKQEPVNLNWDFDECLNAFHKDTLSFLIPYDLHLDYESWWYGGWITRQLISMLYHSYRMQCNSLHVTNHISDRPISKNRYKKFFDYEKPRDYISSALLTKTKARPARANTLIQALLKGTTSLSSPGTLQPGPSVRIPGQPKLKGNHSHLVTPDFILQHWDPTHPMIRKKLTWLQTPEILKILGLDNRRLQPFTPDTLYCTAPNTFSLTIGP